MKLISELNFKKVVGGKKVDLFTLMNKNNLVTQITNYGGRVVSLWVPDRSGSFADIVLGYDTLDGYLNSHESYFGAIIGRYCNRIAGGKFKLGNSTYTLEKNNNGAPKAINIKA